MISLINSARSTKMANKAETILQNKIRIELSKLGCIVLRHDVGIFLSPKTKQAVKIGTIGEPDLTVLCPNGKTVWLEVKIKPNKPTKEQLAFIKRVTEMGHTAAVVYSVEEAVKLCYL